MAELAIRLVASLAVIVGLLMLVVRFGGRRFRGSPDALVRVVHRQALGRNSAVSVVEVSGRLLVLGTTEQQVSVLAELEPNGEPASDPVTEQAQPRLSSPSRSPGGRRSRSAPSAGARDTPSAAAVLVAAADEAPLAHATAVESAPAHRADPAPTPGRHRADVPPTPGKHAARTPAGTPAPAHTAPPTAPRPRPRLRPLLRTR